MLRELQHDLAEAFRESGVDGPAARRVLGVLAPMGGRSTARSLEVYQRSLRSVVFRALAEIFPVCAEVVGDGCFRTVARHHAARHASSHPDLGRIGDTFPDLLPTLDFLDAVPYLADLARLELALHRAASAGDASPIAEPERIADALSERPDAWRLVVSPSATLIESRHPVRSIWHAHRSAAPGDDRFDLPSLDTAERTIVWRSVEGLRVDEVEDRLWPITRAAIAGGPVSQLLQLGVEADRIGDDLAAALEPVALLFARGWVVGVAPLSDMPD